MLMYLESMDVSLSLRKVKPWLSLVHLMGNLCTCLPHVLIPADVWPGRTALQPAALVHSSWNRRSWAYVRVESLHMFSTIFGDDCLLIISWWTVLAFSALETVGFYFLFIGDWGSGKGWAWVFKSHCWCRLYKKQRVDGFVLLKYVIIMQWITA